MKSEPGVFFPARGELVSEQQRGPLVLEGLAVGGMVSAPCCHTGPETRCPSFLVNGAKDRAEMLQPRWLGRGDLSNHTNDFFPSPLSFFFFSFLVLFSFVILEFIFLLIFFFIAKRSLFI